MATATKLSGTYTADPVHSSFAFSVRYQGVSLFKGSLDEVDAKLINGTLEGSAKVESISIRTPEQFRAHVLSADFFDAENHPQVKFVSDDVQLNDDGVVALVLGVLDPVDDVVGSHRVDVVRELDDEEAQEAARRRQTEYLGQESCRLLLVAAPDDRVIELGCHA